MNQTNKTSPVLQLTWSFKRVITPSSTGQDLKTVVTKARDKHVRNKRESKGSKKK